MEVILELIIRGFIINFLGVNIRYQFFRLFRSDVKKENFEDNQADIGNCFAQGFYNFFVGIISFIVLSFGIVYVLYVLNLL